MVRLPIPKLVDRGLAENGPVRLEPAPEQVGFGPRVEDLFGRRFDPAGDRDPEEGGVGLVPAGGIVNLPFCSL
jgi:hypothetical protein